MTQPFLSFLTEEKIKTISQSEAISRKMFGPLYHGTSQENIE